MGWITYHRPAGQTNADHFLADFPVGTIFHATSTERGAFFAAVESPDRPGVVWGFVALIHRAPSSYYNFGTKTMDEDMGPVVLCPRRVLDKLTPTENPYALAWRERSRERAERVEQLRKASDGDLVTFAAPMVLPSGEEFTEGRLTVLRKANGRRIFAIVHEGTAYRLMSNWRELATGYTPAAA